MRSIVRLKAPVSSPIKCVFTSLPLSRFNPQVKSVHSLSPRRANRKTETLEDEATMGQEFCCRATWRPCCVFHFSSGTNESNAASVFRGVFFVDVALLPPSCSRVAGWNWWCCTVFYEDGPKDNDAVAFQTEPWRKTGRVLITWEKEESILGRAFHVYLEISIPLKGRLSVRSSAESTACSVDATKPA